jgi:hypothetical protein
VTVRAILVVIPIVIILVPTVIDLVLVFIVSMVVFLASIVLRLGRSVNCQRGSKGCRKNKGAEKISITMVHVVFLLPQGFPSRNPKASKEYAVIAPEEMSETAHLLRLAEF